MTVQHRLGDDTFLRYAGGTLDTAFATVVASHISMCSLYEEDLKMGAEIGGALLDEHEGAPISSNMRDRLLASLDQDPQFDASMPAPTHAPAGDVPAPLVPFIGAHLSDVPWRTIAPGVKKHVIELNDDKSNSSLFMLHIAAGAAMPEHGHGGEELTLILSGAYTDSMGTFARGDVADLDEHVEHQPTVTADGPCICLVATTAPTRFKDIITKMMQPFLGI